MMCYDLLVGVYTNSLPPSSDYLMTIYVGNLSYQATLEDLTEVFAEYGSVKRVSLPSESRNGSPTWVCLRGTGR